jgi:hypothetical protein
MPSHSYDDKNQGLNALNFNDRFVLIVTIRKTWNRPFQQELPTVILENRQRPERPMSRPSPQSI